MKAESGVAANSKLAQRGKKVCGRKSQR